jgi:hemin uptake protein HemP
MTSQHSRSDRGLAGTTVAAPGLAGSEAIQPPVDNSVRYVRSADLFAGAREVVIQHEKHRYRLKITSRGGMILNK